MFVSFDAATQRLQVLPAKVGAASLLSTRLLVHALHPTRGYATGRLLDVGCGVKPYRDFFGAVQHIGIDWPNSPHKTEIQAYASAEAIPFSDASFDTVLCTEVVEHLPHPQHAMREMARVLKSEGHLILSVPFCHELHEMPHDYFRYTPMALRVLSEEAGLKIVEMWARGGEGGVLANLWFRFLNRRAGRLWRVPLLGKVFKWLFLTMPQNFIAARVEKKPLADALQNPPLQTLGYVLVARKL